jgi:hypothetical protein
MDNISDPNIKDENAEHQNQQSGNELQKMIFISPMVINEEEEEASEDYPETGEEDDDSMDEYGSSGEKYGWYNGYSDDAIDDAFEGDPENTWNVD